MPEMHKASSLESICEKLLPSFITFKMVRRKRPSGEMEYMSFGPSLDRVPEKVLLTDRAKLVGILFAQPSHKVTKEEVLPGMSYFHERSEKNVDFFFAGYNSDRADDPDAVDVSTLAGGKWYYSAKAFNRMRAEVESAVKWRYSGGCDLLLTNARLNEKTEKVQLDFTTSIICPLGEMLRIEAISSVPEFFEEIFRYAEKQDPNDPTWGLSDKLGLDKSGSILKDVVLSLLPKGIGKEAGKLVHLATHDIRKGRK
jgi:hypothetical protein